MFQNTNPQKWAERLALAQGARDELVRLLGVINNLNMVVSREASLQIGARKIVSTLASYLNLIFCGLYIKRAEQVQLEAYSGQVPQAELAKLITLKISEGTSFSTRVIELDDSARLNCMPIFNGESQMGAVAIISPYEMDDPGHRHFKLAMDSVTPVIETFLLRGQVGELDRDLPHSAKNITFPPTPIRAQIPDPGITELNPVADRVQSPQFVLDSSGLLIRFNSALENLVGYSKEKLTGSAFGDLFKDSDQWEELVEHMTQDRTEVEREVTLSVQAGWELKAQLNLVPIFYGSDLISITGHLQHTAQQAANGEPLVPLGEAEELMELTGEAIDHMNNMLTVFRHQTQLMLLKDVPLEVRTRLEVLEKLTMENARGVRRAQYCVGRLSEKCRKIVSEFDLWGR